MSNFGMLWAKMLAIHPKHRSDAHYRYQMPSLKLSYRGKYQNARTFIDNLDKIAAKLGRSSNSILRFLMRRLSTRQDKGALRGTHSSKVLQDLLDAFISSYVLCPSCDNPETQLVRSSSRVEYDCRACGHRRPVVQDQLYKVWLAEAKAEDLPDEDDSEDEEEDVVWSVSLSPSAIARRREDLVS